MTTGEFGEDEPVWVKRRGKWQAALISNVAHANASVLKAKPTYAGRHYLMAFFPQGGLFSWTDSLHLLPLEAAPTPLARGTHETGRQEILSSPKPGRWALLYHGESILDISDRLHLQGVLPSARTANVWRAFARQAAAAVTYQDIGAVLLDLFATILNQYLDQRWFQQRQPAWSAEVKVVQSAAAIEALTKELISKILWDEVQKLWDAPNQPELGPEWEDWKGDLERLRQPAASTSGRPPLAAPQLEPPPRPPAPPVPAPRPQPGRQRAPRAPPAVSRAEEAGPPLEQLPAPEAPGVGPPEEPGGGVVGPPSPEEVLLEFLEQAKQAVLSPTGGGWAHVSVLLDSMLGRAEEGGGAAAALAAGARLQQGQLSALLLAGEKRRRPAEGAPRAWQKGPVVAQAAPSPPPAAWRGDQCRRCMLGFTSEQEMLAHWLAAHGENNDCTEGVEAVAKRLKGRSGQRAWGGPLLRCRPRESEIVAAARAACCWAALQRRMRSLYAQLPPRLPLVAARLCSEQGAALAWTRMSSPCRRQCRASLEPLPPAPPPAPRPLEGGRLLLCADLSGGQEPTPVPCVVDAEMLRPCACSSCSSSSAPPAPSMRPWETFVYVTRRTVDPTLGVAEAALAQSQLGCACAGGGACADPAACVHVQLFREDHPGARDAAGALLGCRFPYDVAGRLALAPEASLLVYECNSQCACGADCRNRVLQRGVQVQLEVFRTRHKGWAVRAGQHIHKGSFVCEYIGEVVGDKEASKRGQQYDRDGCSYLYDIDTHIDLSTARGARQAPFVIDATRHGNVARFINHSCEPNLTNFQVLVESMDCQLAHIGLFAARDIIKGEELAYDYRYKLLPGKGCPCHCGATKCRGRLY